MNPATGATGAIRDYVRYLQRLGVTELPLMLPSQGGAAEGLSTPEPAPSSGAVLLAQLEESVRDCQACRLHEGRRQVVFRNRQSGRRPGFRRRSAGA